jgi:PKD repeat protein
VHKQLIILLLFAANNLFAQNLNHYFGNIHSHSSYSDGNKDSATSLMTKPIQNFLYAKESLQTDFYGISEHNHEGAGMKAAYYFNQGLRDADSATVEGEFIAMYGMEWGVISSGGHILLYGFDSLCGWDFGSSEIYIPEADFTKLWKTINRKPGTFAYLAHPQSGDYGGIFNSPANPTADSAIAGMAMRSGPAFSTNNTYSNPSTGTYLNRYNDALKRGYHLGVGLDHDTHNSVFDRQSAGRLVVMSPILNRTEIIEGIKRRRIYSSDDWNTKVNFFVNNLPMGSIIEDSGNPEIYVNVADPDAEQISSITIYYGVPGSGNNPTVLTSVNNSATLSYSHNISNNNNYYYYLYIVQADGDKIWSSPIWYKRNDAVTVIVPTANFSNSISGCAKYAITLQDSSANQPNSWWWHAPGAYPEFSSLQNPSFVFPSAGNYQVSLTVSNQAGTSATVTKNINVINPPTVTIDAVDTICKGSTANLTANGALNYLWINTSNTNSVYTVSPNFTSQYIVKGFNEFCYDTAIVTVNVVQVLATPIISVSNDTLFSSYNFGNQWYRSTLILPNDTLPYYVPTLSSVYRVQVTDSLGCVSEFSPWRNFQPNSILEYNFEDLFSIYPNPSKGIFKLNYKNIIGEFSATVVDMSGKQIQSKRIENSGVQDVVELDFTGIESGLYMLQISVEDKLYTTKIKIE